MKMIAAMRMMKTMPEMKIRSINRANSWLANLSESPQDTIESEVISRSQNMGPAVRVGLGCGHEQAT
ncbi:MAG TPA: hypothetical protein VHO25_24215 [Polyangiaceae bacterium]|nr:hypothetical protein [Polyangiaceae bacterium]